MALDIHQNSTMNWPPLPPPVLLLHFIKSRGISIYSQRKRGQFQLKTSNKWIIIAIGQLSPNFLNFGSPRLHNQFTPASSTRTCRCRFPLRISFYRTAPMQFQWESFSRLAPMSLDEVVDRGESPMALVLGRYVAI